MSLPKALDWRPRGQQLVAGSLYRKAIGEGRESVTAAIFWLKTRARWKEVQVHEHVAAPETITISQTQEFLRNLLESAGEFSVVEVAAGNEKADGR